MYCNYPYSFIISKLEHIPYGLKANYLCDSTEKQNKTLRDAISECESTPNCEKVLDERCDSQGPFMLCTSASLDIPAPLIGSCIYIRNYAPGKNTHSRSKSNEA